MKPVTELRPPTAMTIAGSDSGGGAGIQADLRTFAFHQVHGTCALTCVTAQNTLGVSRVDALTPDAVVAQIDAIVTDISVQGIKTGMLLNADIIAAVAAQVQRLNLHPLVVDPVMVSRTGSQLLADDAIAALKTELIPLADILTPNRYEAQILSGLEIQSLADMQQAATKIQVLGPLAVLVKGGGMPGQLQGTDVWKEATRQETLTAGPIPTHHTHGTGCTLSAALTAQLALGTSPWVAVQKAKAYVSQALHYPLVIGQGQGPVSHFYPLLTSDEEIDHG